MTERSMCVREMIRSGTWTPEGARALLSMEMCVLWAALPPTQRAQSPCLPSVHVQISLTQWGHQTPPSSACLMLLWAVNPIIRSSLFSFWSSIQPLALQKANLWMLAQKPSSNVDSEGEFPCGYRRWDPMAPALIPGDPASSLAPPLDDCCHSGVPDSIHILGRAFPTPPYFMPYYWHPQYPSLFYFFHYVIFTIWHTKYLFITCFAWLEGKFVKGRIFFCFLQRHQPLEQCLHLLIE